MRKYSIDWLCFYHYWFNWKKILEKPAEILINNKAIDMPFFFSWAHESWNRTRYGGNRELLIEQVYGWEKERETHFNYLLQFFRDNRYIKIDNCPVFVVLRPKEIKGFDAFVLFFNRRAKEHWFDGIHFIETLTFWQKTMVSQYTQSCFCYEPGYTLAWDGLFSKTLLLKWKLRQYLSIKTTLLLNLFDYKKIYKYILWRKDTITLHPMQKIDLWCFVDYDDTARRYGNAIIFNNANPSNFEKYFDLVYQKAKKIKSDFVFITARNERAEWAYLEPDTLYWYGYLEAIKKIAEK